MWKLLTADASLLSLMGLTGQPSEVVNKRIIKRSTYDGLAASEKRLCIYFRPSRRGRLWNVSEQVLQVDCHVPITQDYMALRVIQRVHELLHEQEVGSQRYLYDGHLGELPTAKDFFCAGIRFCYYNVL